MWQFSIFIANRCKHKTPDIWRCTSEDQCIPDKPGCFCRTTTRGVRLAIKAGLLMLRMSVKLTRVTGVLLPNMLPDFTALLNISVNLTRRSIVAWFSLVSECNVLMFSSTDIQMMFKSIYKTTTVLQLWFLRRTKWRQSFRNPWIST